MGRVFHHEIVSEIKSRWSPRAFSSKPVASEELMALFEAARYGIDRLKEIVPVWKKEVGPLGESWVEGDYYPDRKD